MNSYNYNFKNTGKKELNDTILPGAPFLIDGYSYKIIIRPKSTFWRLGIRLSKSSEITFVKSGDRHLSFDPRDFRDIHLSVGGRNGLNWEQSNVLHLAQYNFPEHLIKNHILSTDRYNTKATVEFLISYDSERKLVNIGYNIEESFWSTSILVEEYEYFKVFAWADSIDYELDCEFQIKSVDKIKSKENSLSPFSVGNITFRLGDMFDTYVRKTCNALLLPASSNGTATNSILKKAAEFGIPSPEVKESGEIRLYEPTIVGKLLKAGYAYSVEDKTSSPKIIFKVCKKISSSFSALQVLNKHKYIISLPLLGTGAGGVDPVNVALIYDDEFNRTGGRIKLFVSIQNENTYRIIKERMLGKYISLQDELLQKPKFILELEHNLSTTIDHTAYSLNPFDELNGLALNYITSKDLSFLDNFPALENLALLGCKIGSFDELRNLPILNTLSLISTHLNNTSILHKLKVLESLEISQSEISDLSFLSGLKQITNLKLAENEISQISAISDLKKLHFLDLSSNRINNITSLASLNNLIHLVISNNRISEIEALKNLSLLRYLDISNNRVYDISSVLRIENLHYLKADSNPFIERKDLILGENENHLPPIMSLLLRQAEVNTKEIALPVKVLLLGNHASGKSSILHYVLENNLNVSSGSTHVIKIENYPKDSSEIPEAIFFDFGGQDYYHGIYRAFLTAGSIYLILWNAANNCNQKRVDVHGVLTQDFSIHYWLCQKNYYEQEKYDGEVDPILLIQTHSDKDKRTSCSGFNEIQEFENEFYISLAKGGLPPVNGAQRVNEYALKYLRESLLEIVNKKKSKSFEPIWYINFLNYILNQSKTTSHESKSVSTDLLPQYTRRVPDSIEYLQNDLAQLHKRGLILYYQEEGLSDIIWLNPVALVNYIHSQVLTKKRNAGFKGRVPIVSFSDVPDEILRLLSLQKVIFKHEASENGEPEYIIPNFLPLAEEDSDYDIFTFGLGTPSFILKFKHFFPFGIINQLICHFGDLPEKKKFWRDRLIFTFRNSKVFIHIDFQLLEIRVSSSFSKSHTDTDISDIKSYLFYSIMALYWDFKEVLSFENFRTYFKNGLNIEEFPTDHALYYSYDNCRNLYEKKECRPNDLYISVDDLNYVSYFDLCSDDSLVMIPTKTLNSEREVIDSSKVIPIYPFQPFTKRQLKRPKKVAISYSTKDLDLVNKFRDYLVSLSDDELIGSAFQCTELIAGEEWDDEIQRKFDEADILFFMVSENLMANKYVKDFEIKKAIDRREVDKSFHIIPIILVRCQWTRKGKYSLGHYTSLPFKAQPVTEFEDQHKAWFCAIELIRIMIERDLHPDNLDVVFTNETKRIMEEHFTKKK